MTKSARTAPTSRLPLGLTLTLLLTLAIPIQTQAANFGLEQQIAPETPDRKELSNFGGSVAIDGDTAVVGAFNQDKADDMDGEYGAVYVFERDMSGSWGDPVATLIAPTQSEERFGWSVAIKNEAIIVGAPHFNDGGKIDSGRAFIYSNHDGIWGPNPELELIPSDNASGAQFGYSVDVANPDEDDAYTFVVGAWGDDKEDDAGEIFVGSTYVFKIDDITASAITVNIPSMLTATAKLIDPNGTGKNITYTSGAAIDGDTLGNSVSISADGKTIVAGAFGDFAQIQTPGVNDKEAGTAFVWQRSTGDWENWDHTIPMPPTRELNVITLATEDRFGTSVDVNSGGSIIVVGARGLDYLDSNNTPISGVGAVYLYAQANSNWTGTGVRVPDRRLTTVAPIKGDRIGSSLSIDPDSALIAAGMSDFDEGHTGRPEKVLVWQIPTGGWDDSADDLINDLFLIASDRPIDCAGINDDENDPCDFFGASVSNAVATDGTSIVVGAAGHDNLNSPTTSTPNEFGIAYIYADTTGAINGNTGNANVAPVANNGTASFAKNAFGSITLSGDDEDGDTLTFSILSEPVRGTLSGVPTNLEYQAEDADYTDTFVFKVYDGTDFSDEATITITVGNPSTGGGGSSGGGGGGAWSIYLFAGLFLMPFLRRRIRDSAK